MIYEHITRLKLQLAMVNDKIFQAICLKITWNGKYVKWLPSIFKNSVKILKKLVEKSVNIIEKRIKNSNLNVKMKMMFLFMEGRYPTKMFSNVINNSLMYGKKTNVTVQKVLIER